jgi:hypothetical protein
MARNNARLTGVFTPLPLALGSSCFSMTAPAGARAATTGLPPPPSSSKTADSTSRSSAASSSMGSRSDGKGSNSATPAPRTADGVASASSVLGTSGPTPSTGDLSDGSGRDYERSACRQDCPRGERCVPRVNDRGFAWDASCCEPRRQHPLTIGSGSDVPASDGLVDRYDKGSQYWNKESKPTSGRSSDTNSEDCPAGSEMFHQGFENTIEVCASSRPPTSRTLCDANKTWLHVPEESEPRRFHRSRFLESAGFGEPSELLNACKLGLTCAPATAVPGSSGEQWCTELCGLATASASLSCSGYGTDQECPHCFAPRRKRVGYEHGGLCATPQQRLQRIVPGQLFPGSPSCTSSGTT